MNEYMDSNRALWDEMTPMHAASEFYDVEGFKKGRCTLDADDVREVGDVKGKSLLHLQCHFGMDTLSWARRGAAVTGVDFSEKAITVARLLAGEVALRARFIHCNVYDLPQHLSEEFDIIYTSYGVLCWLPDVAAWAQVAARFVKPGGFLYVRDFHPFSHVFDDAQEATTPTVKLPYFGSGAPERYEPCGGSYAGPGEFHHESYEWTHPIGEIVNALVEAGLRIAYLHEFPYTCYNSHAFLVQDGIRRWRVKNGPELPLMFSIRAERPRQGIDGVTTDTT